MQFVRACFLSQQIKGWHLHKWASCLDVLCFQFTCLLVHKYFSEKVSLKGTASTMSSFMPKKFKKRLLRLMSFILIPFKASAFSLFPSILSSI